MVVITEPAIFIRLTKHNPSSLNPAQLQQLASYCWRVSVRRKKAKYAIAVHQGIILQVYEIKTWQQITNNNILPQDKGRWYFDGIVATDKQHYIGQSVKHYFKPHSSNPITYVNC